METKLDDSLQAEKLKSILTTSDLPEGCTDNGQCETCEGWVLVNNFVSPCPRKEAERRSRWKSYLPKAFAGYVDKPFLVPPGANPATTQRITKLRERVEQAKRFWVKRENQDKGVALYGPVGTGKTHLMMHFVKAFIEATGKLVVVAAEDEYLSAFTAVKGSGDGAFSYQRKLYSRVRNANALFLDDLGSSHSTPARVDNLSELIVKLHRDGATVFWTSNLPLRAITDGKKVIELGIEGRGLIDARAVDRLDEMCVPIATAGLGSWREQNRNRMLTQFQEA